MVLNFRKMENAQKWADFVGDDKQPGESDKDFSSRVIGSLDLLNKQKQVSVDLSILSYKCVGRDDAKVSNFKSKGIDIDGKIVPVGHTSLASEVLVGQMAKKDPPGYFIDGWGNVWQKVEVVHNS
jgi:hypothetical protein